MDYIWFLATIESGEPKLLEEKYDDLRYFNWEELKEMDNLSPNTQNLVEVYFKKEIKI